MLDYDYLCGRSPSVVAIMVNDSHPRAVKLFWGDQEILIPQINTRDACESFGATVLINFASLRTAPTVIKQALEKQLFAYIFTVAEWIPERTTRELIALQIRYPETKLIGPSVVGGIIAWALRIGNTWWSWDNIMKSHLRRAGSVWLVSKSWWMMNEMCRVISGVSDGVHSALQVGGDRFPMTRFRDIVLDYEANPAINMIVLLWEVGNEDENEIAELITKKKIKKPVVARVSWTSAESFTTEIQFGHAGAQAKSKDETARVKNNRLREAGAHVPDSFETFGELIGKVYSWIGVMPQIAGSYEEEQVRSNLASIKHRRGTRFTSTISDERWEELLYNWIPVQEFVEQGSLWKVIWHLWLKKEIPLYACRFIETILILLADHGPAVSGATNTIVTARAWKDMITSVIAWLTTIWPRFWWAIDGAARWIFDAVQQEKTADCIIEEHKQAGFYIPGIGHRIKSIHSPDGRCTLLDTLSNHFPVTRHLDRAKQVAERTTMKKPNLILNVDGYLAAMLLDMFVDIGLSSTEIKHAIDAWLFNWFFVLARTIGFIGHYLDQQRLDEWLHRTPREDILYTD
jgi:ATP-citrate lyase alpha-subunit